MSRHHGWNVSSSEDEDESLLPAKRSRKYLSPAQIKKKLISKQVTSVESSSSSLASGQPCPYGKKCYRKNPQHFKEFTHYVEENMQDTSDEFSQQGDCKTKRLNAECSSLNKDVCEAAAAYNSAVHRFLLTTVEGINSKFNYSSNQEGEGLMCPTSISISDILSQNFGKIKKSAQFNYCIDIEWLVNQYPVEVRDTPLLIVHGYQGKNNNQFQVEAKPYPNIELCRAELPPYGTHHTKMMLLLYEDGLRVVIGTANLVAKDWKQKTQGLWMSPIFPLCNDNIVQESDFQKNLILYLQAYRRKMLESWITVIKQCDMSSANVVLLASVPGRHSGASLSLWGHMRLRSILSANVKGVDATWPVIGQFSSIGSLGQTKDKWLCSEWLESMSSCQRREYFSLSSKKADLKLIFPTVDNVRQSLEGYPAGASLPYSASTAFKQPWLKQFLHKWVAEHSGRSQACPHIKSYTRISPFKTNIRAAWFLLTSANLSKAAWGALEKGGSQLAIKSYELGVLFLPSLQKSASDASNIVGDSYFHLCRNSKSPNKFHLPYSLPLLPYGTQDFPWIWDAPHTDAPDRYGNVWEPS